MRRNSRTEQGSITILAAVAAMTVFLGMVGATYDIGKLWTLRRRMVAAADAGSLAAAQSCASNEGESAASASATTHATGNQSGATPKSITYTPKCDAPFGKVTVEYEFDADLDVSPLFGLPDTRIVTGRAVAIWGRSGAGNPLPFAIPAEWLTTYCDVTGTGSGPAPGEIMECLWDNDNLTSSTFGLIDLGAWGVDENEHCSGVGASEQKAWVQGGGIDQRLEVPAWVCATGGLREDVVDELDDYAEAHPGDVLFFPIIDAHKMQNASQIDKFHVVDYLAVTVLNAEKVTGGGQVTRSCYVDLPSAVATNENLSLSSLVANSESSCNPDFVAPESPVTITKVNIPSERGNQKSNMITPDPAVPDTIQWTGANLPNGFYMEFHFNNQSLAGCGDQTTGNKAAYCIEFEVIGTVYNGGITLECPADETCPGNVVSIRLEE
jgi:hypothetical protein